MMHDPVQNMFAANGLLKRFISQRSLLKVSPAANWHANFLEISLEGIKGTGPKGHILKSDVLKSDVLNHKETIHENTATTSSSFLIELPLLPNDEIIKKCIERIKKISQITELKYKSFPEIGLLQFDVKTKKEDTEKEKFKNLLKIYLNDYKYLLL